MCGLGLAVFSKIVFLYYASFVIKDISAAEDALSVGHPDIAESGVFNLHEMSFVIVFENVL